MRIEILKDVPLLDVVLDMQRAMSKARTEAELVYGFAARFHELSGATEMLDVSVRGLGGGSFRVMDRMVLTDPALSLHNIRDNCRWDSPEEQVIVTSGGAIGKLVKGSTPVIARGLDPATDPVLAGWMVGPRDALAVPVFYRGAVGHWLIVFRAAGLPIDPLRIRVAVAILNMLSRSVYQIKLTREIGELHSRLETELKKVASLQRSILPRRLPVHPALDVAVRYRPCAYAGGDYYDFRNFDDGSIGFVVADVAGHGPAAAVVMAMLRTAMSIYRNLNLPADQIVRTINTFMLDGLTNGTFVTAFFMRINPDSGRVHYANAGHWPAYLRRAGGTLERLDADGSPPLGVLPHIESVGGEILLEAGDTVVLYTDGIPEAFNRRREPFGEQRLARAIGASAGDADAMLQTIMEVVDVHAAGHPPVDDQCLLAVQMQGR